jgi:hypothetical protein
MAEQLDLYSAWNQLIPRMWSDPAFKTKLLANPAGVLTANGATVPAGITVKVVENTDTLVHLVLPVKAPPAELSDEELRQAAGGADTTWRDNDAHDYARVERGTWRDNDSSDYARN